MKQRQVAALERTLVAQELASLLRHDLRNKLGNVRNAAYYIRRRVEQSEAALKDPRVGAFFKLIDDELGAASELIVAGLGQKDAASQPAEPVPLDSCIQDALELAAPPAHVQVRLDLHAPTPHPFQAAEVALLVRYLIENALEAMPASAPSEQVLTLRSAEDPDQVSLTVSDTGPGLSAEAVKRAFEPFFSEKPGHSGLGLRLARRIAAHHGAELRIAESAPGATLVVTFAIASLRSLHGQDS